MTTTPMNTSYWLQKFEARLKGSRITPEWREWYETEISKLKQRLSDE